MEKKLFIGIDNGIRGGIAIINFKNEIVFFSIFCPKNYQEICEYILQKYKEYTFIIGIEKAQSFGANCKMKGKATATYFTNYGILKTTLKIFFKKNIFEIPIQSWQILTKLEDRNLKQKEKALNKVLKLFPNFFKENEKQHDGIVDACLIAYFLKNYYLKGVVNEARN